MKRRTGIGVMVLMSALVVTVACGDDDSPTAPTTPSPTPPMESTQQLELSFNGLENLGWTVSFTRAGSWWMVIPSQRARSPSTAVAT